MRVAIAEDSGIFRQALVTLLSAVGVDVAFAARTGDELLASFPEPPPDVAILDLHMPPNHTDEGLTTAHRIKQQHPGVGVLILSAYNDTPQAMALFESSTGGVGYLLKDHVSDVTTLRDALERIIATEIVIDPEVVSRLVIARQRADELAPLSSREREVLALMAEGHSNAGIARRIHLSERTIEDHVRAVFVKLGIADTEPDRRLDSNKRVRAVLTWLRATRHD